MQAKGATGSSALIVILIFTILALAILYLVGKAVDSGAYTTSAVNTSTATSEPNNKGRDDDATNDTAAVAPSGRTTTVRHLDFRSEGRRAMEKIACISPKITPAGFGEGALYGCIQGTAQTAKLFINEEPETGAVKNIKVMWNDWFQDVGYGVHPDASEAHLMVKALASLYVPDLERKLVAAFFADINAAFESEDFTVVYTYRRGPKIDERLLVLTPKYTIAKTEHIISSAKSYFESCKKQVASFIGYRQLTGDGEPVKETGYVSFMLEGGNRDIFFCEVYPNRTFKIKAALGGQFPFKYVAQGSL